MKRRLIYLAPGRATFVMQDIEWLEKTFKVEQVFFKLSPKVFVPFRLVGLLIKLLILPRATVLISFGGYHSFVGALVAKIKRVRCFIILNGTDSAAVPEWNYGHLRGGPIKWFCLQSYRMATKLLPVSESLMENTNTYAFNEPKRLGIKAVTDEAFAYSVIPNGFDLDLWTLGKDKERRSFVTVIGSEERIFHKGLDLILEVAPKFPASIFYVVGLSKGAFDHPPANVVFTGYLNNHELRKVYQQCEYYLQLSVWEGFGCALCEAMLCGCVPVVSNVNMLPEIIGETGWVLERREMSELERILKTLDTSKTSPDKQIAENFPMSHRIGLIINELQNDY